MKAAMGSLVDKVTSWFKPNGIVMEEVVIAGGRKLLGSSSFIVTTSGVATGGYNVVAEGSNAGIDAKTPSGVQIMSIMTVVMVALF